jgi:hypothetical protein
MYDSHIMNKVSTAWRRLEHVNLVHKAMNWIDSVTIDLDFRETHFGPNIRRC